ncbi:unnamed protein product, partial [Staurois parvus]
MALGMNELTSGVIKGLTVCWLCVRFTVSTLVCMAAAVCRSWQGRDLYYLHTGLSPVGDTR